MYANDKYINTILLSILSYIQHMDHQQFQSLQQTWGLESISTRLTSLNQPKTQISQQKTAIKTVQQKTLRFCVAAPCKEPPPVSPVSPSSTGSMCIACVRLLQSCPRWLGFRRCRGTSRSCRSAAGSNGARGAVARSSKRCRAWRREQMPLEVGEICV